MGETACKMRTPEEVKADFIRHGLPIAEWARQHKISPKRVYDVLSRRNKGSFGEAHRAAVLLGIKEGSLDDSEEL